MSPAANFRDEQLESSLAAPPHERLSSSPSILPIIIVIIIISISINIIIIES